MLTDERIFDNAVELSAEDVAQNEAHFAAKGMAAEVEPTDISASTPEPEPPPVVDAAPPAPAAPTEVIVPAEVEGTTLDDESRADWQTADTDEKKLGRYAKRTRQFTELKDQLSAKDRELETLRAKVAEVTPAPAALAPAAAASAPTVTEQPAPKAFEEAEPTQPNWDDFVDEPDQHKAYSAATAAYAKSVNQWYDRRRQHDDTQRVEVENQRRQNEETNRVAQQAAEATQSKLVKARIAHPDFDERIRTMPRVNPALDHLFSKIIPDGYELFYELAAPEHRERAAALYAETDIIGKTPEQIEQILFAATDKLATFRHEIKTRAAAPPPVPPAAAPPPATAPVPVPQVTHPTEPPRREEAAPTPQRGRSASVSQRPEDLDAMDSDARRALRKQLGTM